MSEGQKGGQSVFIHLIIYNFVSYLLDERHVFFIFRIGAIFILHLNCDNWATLGILRIN